MSIKRRLIVSIPFLYFSPFFLFLAASCFIRLTIALFMLSTDVIFFFMRMLFIFYLITDPSCQELVKYMGTLDLKTIDAGTAATKVSVKLQLDRCSMEDPPEDVVKKCRYFCLLLKKEGRTDIVEELRKILPSGITGRFFRFHYYNI